MEHAELNKIEIKILDKKSSIATDILFDTNDYSGLIIEKSEIEEDITQAVECCMEEPEKKRAFLLLNPINNVSISSIYRILRTQYEKHETGNIQIYVKSESAKNYIENALLPTKPLIFKTQLNQKIVTILTGDICDIKCDAIVNASNTRLVLGAGVSGAIHQKAGPALQTEMSIIANQNVLKPGDARITRSYNLTTCKYIIHAATANGSEKIITKSIYESLQLCEKYKIKSLVFPALGTGTGGLNMKICAKILKAGLLKNNEAYPNEVIVVLTTKKKFEILKKEI